MKLKKLLAISAFALAAFPMFAQQYPKQEMRSAWVATVWRLDWPQTTMTVTGDAKQIARQQNQMIEMLDSLAANNYNAINFQVRSRCDAMYKSSFEPWSSDLVDVRGKDPGWDPLQFVVEECHKRGMECHAWLNPYRYESQVRQWDGTPKNYRADHPDWLIDVTGSNGTTTSILNPGLPEVTQRICDIIKEIVHNYDVDGVLFDDYFYLSGTNTTHDGALYNAYTAGGGKLSIGDWRRSNVNNMIKSVYKTIKDEKSWVRFGVSPAGIACTSASVARKYGISPMPTGSDWQYNDIYSDPIAWISEQNLDFISPQVYWTIGYSTNYELATKWWSEIAHKWNRHVYISSSVTSLTAGSKAPERSTVEENIGGTGLMATGPNSTYFAEYANEVRLNRQYNQDDAPGSIFYSAKYLYKVAPLFSHYMKQQVFQHKALMPALSWQSAPRQELVKDLARSGSSLTWKGVDNMRYTVYAFPESMDAANFVREPEYLIGVSYTENFTIPSDYLSGYKYAVCMYDRYGNEYSPALPGVASVPLSKPAGLTPAANTTIEVPFDFSWNAVPDAAEYIVEICSDKEMTKRIDQRSTTATSISTTSFAQLPIDTQLYWRVRACGAGKADGLSDVVPFKVQNLLILSPANGATGMSVTPTFTYSIPDREVTLEIAETTLFEDQSMVATVTGKGGSISVPRFMLAGANTYYARMRYLRAGVEMITNTLEFTTQEMPMTAPSIAKPVEGGTLHADEQIVLAPIDGAKILRVEVSASSTFPSRTSYSTSAVNVNTLTDPNTADKIRLNGKYLTDGTTYYARARAGYNTLADKNIVNSEYGPTVTFVYSAESSTGVDAVVADNAFVKVQGRAVIATGALSSVSVCDAAGTVIMSRHNIANSGTIFELPSTAGVYIITAVKGHEAHTVKAAVK